MPLTAHSVRRLRVCVVCGAVGIYQPTDPATEVPVVVCVHSTPAQRRTVPARRAAYAHPRCYVAETTLDNLLALHPDELGSIRLSDVTQAQMRRILRVLTRAEAR